ncbi:hypothetical protein [Streptomyces paromomycinus]|uniref:Uncharacterized protein n=1 Tax=Streptomyces paromomycinus TaxID=92743 RepID=A0A401VXR1_STREY|nr:hypothetical protein [Streptomyces paromomycinus]GCD41852.1 hypothetical protein GKJPGBOP_01509 [Streptomyces paromomycinus]
MRDNRATDAATVSPGVGRLVISESHPGTRPHGLYNDLRDEQTRCLAESAAPGRLPAPPATPAPRRSR